MLPNDWPAECWFGDIWLQAGASQSFMPRYPGMVRYPTSNAKERKGKVGGDDEAVTLLPVIALGSCSSSFDFCGACVRVWEVEGWRGGGREVMYAFVCVRT